MPDAFARRILETTSRLEDTIAELETLGAQITAFAIEEVIAQFRNGLLEQAARIQDLERRIVASETGANVGEETRAGGTLQDHNLKHPKLPNDGPDVKKDDYAVDNKSVTAYGESGKHDPAADAAFSASPDSNHMSYQTSRTGMKTRLESPKKKEESFEQHRGFSPELELGRPVEQDEGESEGYEEEELQKHEGGDSEEPEGEGPQEHDGEDFTEQEGAVPRGQDDEVGQPPDVSDAKHQEVVLKRKRQSKSPERDEDDDQATEPGNAKHRKVGPVPRAHLPREAKSKTINYNDLAFKSLER